LPDCEVTDFGRSIQSDAELHASLSETVIAGV
jgi:hypothetical protein